MRSEEERRRGLGGRVERGLRRGLRERRRRLVISWNARVFGAGVEIVWGGWRGVGSGIEVLIVVDSKVGVLGKYEYDRGVSLLA